MSNQPVTRGGLHEALTLQKHEILEEVSQAIRQSESRLKGEILDSIHQSKSKLKDEILDSIRQTETALLKAFFAYQEHAEVRMRKMSADVSNVNTASELRLNNLEQRVIQIEKKLMLDPPAA